MYTNMPDNFWTHVDKIEGWLFKEEAELLYDLSVDKPKDTIWVEIGSWKGRSTCVLAAANEFGYAIDWFQGNPKHDEEDTRKEFEANTALLSNKFSLIPFDSEKARGMFFEHYDEIGLFFIDGNHYDDQPRKDFELYEKLVVVGGYVVFHDAWGEEGDEEYVVYHDVTNFVKELRSNPKWKEVKKVRRCAVFQRVEY